MICNHQNTEIVINNTQALTGANPNSNKTRSVFYINDVFFQNTPDYLWDKQDFVTVYNLSDIITHEFGHILGFGHYDKVGGGFTCNNSSSGIMNATAVENKPK